MKQLFIHFVLLVLMAPAMAAAAEPDSDLFQEPHIVEISGYDGNAMEPFISPDGKTLYFNNENDASVNTELFEAERTGKNSFRFKGPVAGVNSDKLEAVASVDNDGNLYFTSLRSYEDDLKSLYRRGADGTVSALGGDITPKRKGSIDMDASISPDGKTLYISRAKFGFLNPVPKRSDLLFATRDAKGDFNVDANSAAMLAAVNTGALEYAPAVSANGLELYFTRADEQGPRIMVATRADTASAFGTPARLSALTGFVEAPSVAPDGHEMFFHRKEGPRFLIYRAERTAPDDLPKRSE